MKQKGKAISLLGRLLFSLIFVTAAPRHFSNEGIRHAAALGVPAAGILGPLSGLMAFAGGLSVALGYKAKWGAWTLVAFLMPVTFCMHAFWRLHDPAAAHVQQAMFAKNLSVIGAALLIPQFGGGGLSVDERGPMENGLSRKKSTPRDGRESAVKRSRISTREGVNLFYRDWGKRNAGRVPGRMGTTVGHVELSDCSSLRNRFSPHSL